MTRPKLWLALLLCIVVPLRAFAAPVVLPNEANDASVAPHASMQSPAAHTCCPDEPTATQMHCASPLSCHCSGPCALIAPTIIAVGAMRAITSMVEPPVGVRTHRPLAIWRPPAAN